MTGAGNTGAVGLFARGIAMGAADIVPGVSGGTVALMTGIYDRLIRAIVAVDRDCLGLLIRGRLSAVWHRIDGGFLLPLLLGIVTAIFALASTIHWLLEAYQCMRQVGMCAQCDKGRPRVAPYPGLFRASRDGRGSLRSKALIANDFS